PGPVLVDIPKDVQIESADVDVDRGSETVSHQPSYAPHPLQVKKAVELLSAAERPMIIAGGGVIASNASQELLAVAELLMAPVATTLMGKGAIPENHPLATGLMGMHGTVASNKLVQEADVLLAVGTRFSDRTTGKVDEFCPDAKIIHIDIDAAEIGKNVEADVPIVADAKKALREIYKLLQAKIVKKERSTLVAKIKEFREQLEGKANCEGELKPPRLMIEIRQLLPDDAIITTEVGQNQMWAAIYLKVYKPRTFISSGGLGTMGFGFPAALGAKVAHPEVPVVDIAGDGSFIMTEQDLATSVEENIPVIVVVLNNSVLGMVAQWQRLFYNGRYFAVNLGKVPDFVKLAEAYGAQGFRARTLEEFSSALKKALQSDVTSVIDVPISPEENVLPMVPPGKGLKWMIWE
ncbi:MAG: thiamine pyrophosphate-dependent enzyme, partial [Candidatus Bathyarchaeia archaeon]